MSKILIVCPTIRDIRELERINKGEYTFLYYDYVCSEIKDLVAKDVQKKCIIPDPEIKIKDAIEKYKNENLDGIFSTDDYPGTILANILSFELGFKSVHPKMSLLSQQKYYSRQIQKEVVPEAVPSFFLIDIKDQSSIDKFPFFIKPVKSFLSVGSQIVLVENDLQQIKKTSSYDDFLYPFEVFLKKYTGYSIGSCQLIGESILSGSQVTLDGYVFENEVNIIGIVDSIMFEGTNSFKRFEYPSQLPQSVQERMSEIAKLVIKKFEFNNCLFNIEFMYDEANDRIHIIELHPRMSSQFADIYEKVDGINSYNILLNIIDGKNFKIEKLKGKYKMAASCVLRVFQNCFIESLPTKKQIESIYKLSPDIRIEIFAKEGLMLSNFRQDCQSFRYGILNIGGSCIEEILEIFDECKKLLSFKFKPVT